MKQSINGLSEIFLQDGAKLLTMPVTLMQSINYLQDVYWCLQNKKVEATL